MLISPYKNLFKASVSAVFPIPIGVPENFILSDLTPVSLDMFWDVVDGASYYQVQRANNENFIGGVVVYTGTDNSFTDITITPITTYYYRVRILVNGIPGNYSDYETITTIRDNSYSIVYPMVYT